MQPSLGLQAHDALRAVASARSEWLESVEVSSFCDSKSVPQKCVPWGWYFLSLLEEAVFLSSKTKPNPVRLLTQSKLPFFEVEVNVLFKQIIWLKLKLSMTARATVENELVKRCFLSW